MLLFAYKKARINIQLSVCISCYPVKKCLRCPPFFIKSHGFPWLCNIYLCLCGFMLIPTCHAYAWHKHKPNEFPCHFWLDKPDTAATIHNVMTNSSRNSFNRQHAAPADSHTIYKNTFIIINSVFHVFFKIIPAIVLPSLHHPQPLANSAMMWSSSVSILSLFSVSSIFSVPAETFGDTAVTAGGQPVQFQESSLLHPLPVP